MESDDTAQRTTRIHLDRQRVKELARLNERLIGVVVENNGLVLIIKHKTLVRESSESKKLKQHAPSQGYLIHITFLAAYPLAAPSLYVESPIPVHPNIDEQDGTITVRWQQGELLDKLVEHLWRIIVCQEVDEEDELIRNRVALEEFRKWREERKIPLMQQQLQPLPPEEDAERTELRSPSNVSATATPSAMRAQAGFQPITTRSHQPQDMRFPDRYKRGKADIYDESRRIHWRYTNAADNPYTVYGRVEVADVYRVVLSKEMLLRIFEHACGDPYNERFGILLGGVFLDTETRKNWVEVGTHIAAMRVQANSVAVEVSSDELHYLNTQVDDILAQTQETIRKLGWYHTHPGHGIFMSSTDRDNQRMSYTANWHLALVVDPQQYHYGLFAGPESKPVRWDSVVVVSDEDAQAAQSPVYRGVQVLRPRLPGLETSARRESQGAGGPGGRGVARREEGENVGLQSSGSTISPQPPENNAAHLLEQEQAGTSPSAATPGSAKPKFLEQLLKYLPQNPLGLGTILLLLFAIIVVVASMLFAARAQAASSGLQSQLQRTQKQLQIAQGNIQQDSTLIGQNTKTLRQTQTKLNDNEKTVHDEQDALLKQVPLFASEHAKRVILQTVIDLDASSPEGIDAQQQLKQLGPVTTTYTVQSGDTISGIAQFFDVSQDALLKANPKVAQRPNYSLKAGETLVIPES